VCRCDERLKVKTEGSTRLTYTGLRGGYPFWFIDVQVNHCFVKDTQIHSLIFVVYYKWIK
jgi:hypothetical protein